MDYIALSMTLTFDTCDTRRCVNVSIVEDIVNEPDEVFDYSLVPAPIGLDPRITIRPDMGAVLITDNDGNNKEYCDKVNSLYLSTGPIVVGYEFTTYQTNETDSSVDLSIIVINPPSVGAPRPFSLSVSTRGISAGIQPLESACIEPIRWCICNSTYVHSMWNLKAEQGIHFITMSL